MERGGHVESVQGNRVGHRRGMRGPERYGKEQGMAEFFIYMKTLEWLKFSGNKTINIKSFSGG